VRLPWRRADPTVGITRAVTVRDSSAGQASDGLTLSTLRPVATRSGSSRPEVSKGRWQAIRQRVRRRDGNQCTACGIRGSDGARLSVHHIERGGPDTMENLTLLCSRCHARADANARWHERETRDRRTGTLPLINWPRHWYGPQGYDERCMRCRKLGKPCADALP
jgi:5-methylcytosine-specific restriction endonuclease McrA